MKLIVLYRPDSEHATATEMYLRDFRYQNPDIKVEVVIIDSRQGASLIRAYEIVRYPALVAARTDDSPLFIWQGADFPLMNEVASYLYST